MSNRDRQAEAFFYTRDAAERCRERLGVLFQVSEPEPVEGIPVNGRNWRLTIDLPQGLTLSTMYVDPTLVNKISEAVLDFNGTFQQNPR